jgi:hypothetical protein
MNEIIKRKLTKCLQILLADAEYTTLQDVVDSFDLRFLDYGTVKDKQHYALHAWPLLYAEEDFTELESFYSVGCDVSDLFSWIKQTTVQKDTTFTIDEIRITPDGNCIIVSWVEVSNDDATIFSIELSTHPMTPPEDANWGAFVKSLGTGLAILSEMELLEAWTTSLHFASKRMLAAPSYSCRDVRQIQDLGMLCGFQVPWGRIQRSTTTELMELLNYYWWVIDERSSTDIGVPPVLQPYIIPSD